MARKKIEKPTRAMRDAAWRALHEVVVDPRSGDTARVSAARALVKDDPEAAEAAEAAAKAAAGPPAVFVIPDNGRDPLLRPLGVARNEGAYMITYDGESEAGLANLARWEAEVRAEIAAEFPPTPLALPAPPVKVRLSEAERKARYRARLKAEKAAKELAPPSPSDSR